MYHIFISYTCVTVFIKELHASIITRLPVDLIPLVTQRDPYMFAYRGWERRECGRSYTLVVVGMPLPTGVL